MPQANYELRSEMARRFGSETDSAGPMKYLKGAGYSLTRDWEWFHPHVKSVGEMTRDEFDCLLFLVHEWDFGSLKV